MMRRLPIVCLLLVAAFLFVATTRAMAADAYRPPDIRGHVTDTAGKLQPNEIDGLNTKLSDYRKCSSNHVAVFVAASLESRTIEDVAYVTFNTWKVGAGGKDNGVLLVVAPNERKSFIATGKGVGGSLPDVAAFHILRDKVTPRLKEEKFFAAVDDGTTAIGAALGGCPVNAAVVSSAAPAPKNVLAPTVPPPKAESHTAARCGMIGGLALLAFFLGWGMRASVVMRLFAMGFAAFFSLIMTFMFTTADVFDIDAALGVSVIIGGLMLVANIIVWVMRSRIPVRTGPFDPDSPENRAANAGSFAGSFGDSSSSSSSSSFSSSDNSYSGGGGSTGGGGAGDSY